MSRPRNKHISCVELPNTVAHVSPRTKYGSTPNTYIIVLLMLALAISHENMFDMRWCRPEDLSAQGIEATVAAASVRVWVCTRRRTLQSSPPLTHTNSVPSRLTRHNPQFTFHGSRFTIHGSRFTIHHSRLKYDSLFTVQDSRLKIPRYKILDSRYSPYTIHDSRLYDSRFTIHDSRFTIHNLRSTIQDSRFKIPHSRFPTRGSRFTIQDSRFALLQYIHATWCIIYSRLTAP